MTGCSYTTGCGDRLPACCTPSAGHARTAGSPSSTWNVAEINDVTTGAVVRQALDAITVWDWQQSRDASDQEPVTAFRDRLLDVAEYEVHALEV